MSTEQRQPSAPVSSERLEPPERRNRGEILSAAMSGFLIASGFGFLSEGKFASFIISEFIGITSLASQVTSDDWPFPNSKWLKEPIQNPAAIKFAEFMYRIENMFRGKDR